MRVPTKRHQVANVDAQTVLAIVGGIGACIGAYTAIRADLARLHERVDGALSAATRAHERIDDMHKQSAA